MAGLSLLKFDIKSSCNREHSFNCFFFIQIYNKFDDERENLDKSLLTGISSTLQGFCCVLDYYAVIYLCTYNITLR